MKICSVNLDCETTFLTLSHGRHQIPSSFLRTIVDALVLSHVRYCLEVYDNESENNMQRLQKMLNFCLREVWLRNWRMVARYDTSPFSRSPLSSPSALAVLYLSWLISPRH